MVISNITFIITVFCYFEYYFQHRCLLLFSYITFNITVFVISNITFSITVFCLFKYYFQHHCLCYFEYYFQHHCLLSFRILLSASLSWLFRILLSSSLSFVISNITFSITVFCLFKDYFQHYCFLFIRDWCKSWHSKELAQIDTWGLFSQPLSNFITKILIE